MSISKNTSVTSVSKNSMSDSMLNVSLSQLIQSNPQACDFLNPYLDQKCPLILYFYPKDNTSGCTQQAIAAMDHLEEFKQRGITLVGISKDSAKSHSNFAAKYGLEFPLIADVDLVLCKLFDVLKEKSMYGKKYLGVERSTFYIDETGLIRHIWRNVKISNHWLEVLSTL